MSLRLPETIIVAALAYCFMALGVVITGRRPSGILQHNQAFLVGLSAAAMSLFPLSVLLANRALLAILAVLLWAGVREFRHRSLRVASVHIPAVCTSRKNWLPLTILSMVTVIFVYLNWRVAFAWDGYQVWATKALFLHERGGLTPYPFYPDTYERLVDYPSMIPLYQSLVTYLRGEFIWESVKPVFFPFFLSLLISTYHAATGLVDCHRALWAAALVPLAPGISMLTSAGGYVDMPQAVFVAAVTAALLCRAQSEPTGLRDPVPWLMAGMTAVKSEGLILFVITCGVILLAWRAEGDVRSKLKANSAAILLALSAPVLKFLLLRWNHSQDREFGADMIRTLQRLWDVPFLAYGYLSDFRYWGFLWPSLALAIAVVLWRGTKQERLLGMAAGAAVFAYTGIFYFTNWDLRLHMESAYQRILAQLVPISFLCIIAGVRVLSGLPAVSPGAGRRPAALGKYGKPGIRPIVSATPPVNAEPRSALIAPTRMDRFAPVLAAFIVLIAVARISLTWSVFSQTWDEPGHISCGLQYLLEGRYVFERQHPPLARMAVALGPWLTGANFGPTPAPSRDAAGLDALYAGGQYKNRLSLARAGIIPFLVLGAAVIWVWARRIGGSVGALFALLLFTTSPPVLAHGGVATTDMPSAATLTLALFTLVLWWMRPTLPRSLLLSLTVAVTIYTKYSALAFLPACVMVLLVAEVVRRWRHPTMRRTLTLVSVPWAKLLLICCLCLFLLWAGFLFSFDHIRMGAVVMRWFPTHPELLQYRVPMPEFVDGILEVINHNESGHPAYLLGQYSEKGWWSFFPVALAVKSPIPLLLLCVLAAATLIVSMHRRRTEWWVLLPLLFTAAIMAVAIAGNINIGVRHILAVYPLIAITAGVGAALLFTAGGIRARIAVIALLSWQTINSVTAHPDYLAWFNEFVRTNPEHVLVDSDFDWGQDLDRLAAWTRDQGLKEISLIYFGCTRPAEHGIPGVRILGPGERGSGWIAVSITNLTKMNEAWREFNKGRRAFEWLDAYRPKGRVGRTILLYYVPPDRLSK